jgi:K+-sensing histidine kinase KdpD
MALAEELKTPLMQIARQAELLETHGKSVPEDQLRYMRHNADMTLRLIDSYLFTLRLSRDSRNGFSAEPVSISSILHEARARLLDAARERNIALHLNIAGKYEPVLAHPQALTSALITLGYTLIDALPANGSGQFGLRMAAHRTKHGIVAGMYFNSEALTPEALRRAQKLYGHARQPFVEVLPGSGAGVFVAEAILAAMSSRLRVGRYQKLPGFAVTLTPSQQMQLV